MPPGSSAPRRQPGSSLPVTFVLITATMLLTIDPSSAMFPKSTFVELWAPFLHKSQGVMREPANVLDSALGLNQCECLVRCFTSDECLGWSHDPTSDNCTLHRVRGRPDTVKPQPGTKFRIRRHLAYLGDWCHDNKDCDHLTSGDGICEQNTCSCPHGHSPTNLTTCVRQASTSGEPNASTSAIAATSTTSATTATTEAISTATKTAGAISTTTATTEETSTTTATTKETSTTTETAEETSTTTEATGATSTAATTATSTATKTAEAISTTTATTEETSTTTATTKETSTTTETAEETSTTTEATGATFTAATTATSASTGTAAGTSTTTSAIASTRPTTTTMMTTLATTTQNHCLQDDELGDNWQLTYQNRTKAGSISCSSNCGVINGFSRKLSVLAGGVYCTLWSAGMSLEETKFFEFIDTTMNTCPVDAVMVALGKKAKFKYGCASVQGNVTLDTQDCKTVYKDDNDDDQQPLLCDEDYFVTGLHAENVVNVFRWITGLKIKAIECCRIGR